MKKIVQTAVLALLVSTAAVSCKKKNNDAELQASTASVIATHPGASVEVVDGVAHLSGEFATPQERDNMINSLKAIPGIKSVHDMTTLAPPPAPVETTSAAAPDNVQKINDALKDYPGVTATEKNGELTITGEVSREQARQIKTSVDAMHLGKVNYNYIVK